MRGSISRYESVRFGLSERLRRCGRQTQHQCESRSIHGDRRFDDDLSRPLLETPNVQLGRGTYGSFDVLGWFATGMESQGGCVKARAAKAHAGVRGQQVQCQLESGASFHHCCRVAGYRSVLGHVLDPNPICRQRHIRDFLVMGLSLTEEQRQTRFIVWIGAQWRSSCGGHNWSDDNHV